MRRHFMYKHPNDTINITEEGGLIRCPVCNFCIPHTSSLSQHNNSPTCKIAQARLEKQQHTLQQEQARTQTFTLAGQPIETVSTFKYLGRILDKNDDDLPAIKANIQKAKKRWARITRVLTRENASPRVMGYFYKAVVQSVLLYGSETWVLSTRMLQLLESFHYRCARYISKMYIRKLPDSEQWDYPDRKQVLATCGLWTIKRYIECRKTTITSYAKSRPIYEKCTTSTRTPMNVNQLTWW